MSMPGFTADRSLQAARGYYRGSTRGGTHSRGIVPAIPNCANCDAILDRCMDNGNRPRALCRACAFGDCFSGEENPGGQCRIEPRTGRVICDL
jgi:hypothetical protein